MCQPLLPNPRPKGTKLMGRGRRVAPGRLHSMRPRHVKLPANPIDPLREPHGHRTLAHCGGTREQRSREQAPYCAPTAQREPESHCEDAAGSAVGRKVCARLQLMPEEIPQELGCSQSQGTCAGALPVPQKGEHVNPVTEMEWTGHTWTVALQKPLSTLPHAPASSLQPTSPGLARDRVWPVLEHTTKAWQQQ